MPATILLSAHTVAEQPEDLLIGTLSVDGGNAGETFTFALAASSDLFEIVGNELKVKSGALFDYETLKLIEVSITATSTEATGGTNVRDGAFSIDVTNVNEAPTAINVTGGTVAEDSIIGTEVATLAGVDQDAADVLTYSFVTDATGATAATSALFEIAGDKIKVKSVLDQAQVGSHNLFVKVTDAAGLSYVKQVTLNVTDSLENVLGTNRNDRLVGSDLADLLTGLGGNDKINGMGGDDVINGGLGKDMLTGGAGKDTFVFDTAVKKGHFDHVTDFNSADDTLQFNLAALKSIKVKASKKDVEFGDFKGKKTASFGLDKVFKQGKLEKKFFTVGDHAKDSNDYVFYNKKNGIVYLDVDGAGGKKGIEILKLKPKTAISVDDFLFV